MNSKNIILVLTLISITITKSTVAVPASNRLATKAQSMLKTFKNDMSCLFSRTRKCTDEQKKRIIKGAVGITLLIVGSATIIKYGVLPHKREHAIKQERQENQKIALNFINTCAPRKDTRRILIEKGKKVPTKEESETCIQKFEQFLKNNPDLIKGEFAIRALDDARDYVKSGYRKKMIKRLFEHGKDLHTYKTTNNDTLLHIFVGLSGPGIDKKLLDLGADPFATNNQGLIPLQRYHYHSRRNPQTRTRLIEKMKILQPNLTDEDINKLENEAAFWDNKNKKLIPPPKKI